MSDFEKSLSRIPLHPAPAEWRAEILRTARAAAPDPAPAPWWQRWLTPQRIALAAVWLLIAILRSATQEESTVSAPASVAQLETRVSVQLALIAELLNPPAPPPRPPPPHGAVLSRRHARFA